MRILFFLFLSGCAATDVAQVLDPEVYYKHDIKFEVSSQWYNGVGVIPKKGRYKIKIKTPGKIDLMKITTCHRQKTTEDIPDGWFKTGRVFKYTYEPVEPIERVGSCMMKIEAYEAGTKARHSSALIEFEQDDHTLTARVSCNGKEWDSAGVGICQSWEGLEQAISFQTPVKVGSIDRCKIRASVDKKLFIYSIKNRECTYAFESDEGEKFRLQTVGYENVPIRFK